MGQYNFFAAFALLATLVPFTAHADSDHSKYLSISIENDNFGGDTDQYYTSGVRATWFDAKTSVPEYIQEMTEYIPTFDVDDKTGTYFSLGHNIYTPQDIRIEQQPLDDRPWAAFLYGSIGLLSWTLGTP